MKLGLRASRFRGRQTRLVGVFAPTSKTVARGGRKLLLEYFDGRGWRRFAGATTSSTGVATWTLTLRHGSYRLRARYTGADDLAPATSRALTLRLR